MKRMLASIATATLALGGLVATATPASAHTPDIDVDCENLTVELWAYADAGQHSWWHSEKHGKKHGSDDKKNTVTVTVNGEVEIDETFGKSFKRSVELDPTKANDWTVEVDAWDNDAYDLDKSGTTEPCAAPSPTPTPDPEPEREIETAFYVYPKLDPEELAAWDNSGKQWLVTTRDGSEFWETLPDLPGSYFDAEEFPFDPENVPQEVCEGWGVQQDTVGIHEGFDWSDFLHITYHPDRKQGGPYFQDLKKARHDELSKYLPACAEEPPGTPEAPEPVTPPTPSFIDECFAESSVVHPETELATYTDEWNADKTEVTVTASAAEGVQFAEGAETSWTFTFSDKICDEPVTPELPKVEDLCGTENDDVRVPKNTDEVTYETTSTGIVATPAEGYVFDELPTEYTAHENGTALYTVPEGTFTDEPCATEEPAAELIPGEIGAVCDAESPYLVYEVSLPEGVEAEGDNPLTVTFINPDGDDHVTANLPLEGRLLWPGASAEEPLQWPGWEQLDDGSYVETDGNFAWTRDGVQVEFRVNPDYSTVVNYPPASEDCADAPSDVRQAAAQTVVDVPEDGAEVAAEEDELAVTGATVGVATAVALLLIAGGVTLFIVRRRLQQS
ncbi:hypothetical protein UQW22_07665 [Isoptericola halotolerans]|uniref:hypothetical protein n=1 Tax=Isoptericola halotolerans TaxID=300560 RepID=UPI00388E619D